jgi:hypothetical protein
MDVRKGFGAVGINLQQRKRTDQLCITLHRRDASGRLIERFPLKVILPAISERNTANSIRYITSFASSI